MVHCNANNPCYRCILKSRFAGHNDPRQQYRLASFQSLIKASSSWYKSQKMFPTKNFLNCISLHQQTSNHFCRISRSRLGHHQVALDLCATNWPSKEKLSTVWLFHIPVLLLPVTQSWLFAMEMAREWQPGQTWCHLPDGEVQDAMATNTRRGSPGSKAVVETRMEDIEGTEGEEGVLASILDSLLYGSMGMPVWRRAHWPRVVLLMQNLCIWCYPLEHMRRIRDWGPRWSIDHITCIVVATRSDQYMPGHGDGASAVHSTDQSNNEDYELEEESES